MNNPPDSIAQTDARHTGDDPSQINAFEVKIRRHAIAAICLLATMVGALCLLYVSQFNGPLSTSNADWGSAGDFFGGILNPIISGLTAVVVLIAFFTQREELRRTHQALLSQSMHLEEQKNELTQQTLASLKQGFDQTFFQLLENLALLKDRTDWTLETRPTYSRTSRDLWNDIISYNWGYYCSSLDKSVFRHSEISETFEQCATEGERVAKFFSWFLHGSRRFYAGEKKLHMFGEGYYHNLYGYFSLIEEIIRHIDEADIMAFEKKVGYARILVSNLTKDELMIVFYCSFTDDFPLFKMLFSKYGILANIVSDDCLPKSKWAEATDGHIFIWPEASGQTYMREIPGPVHIHKVTGSPPSSSQSS